MEAHTTILLNGTPESFQPRTSLRTLTDRLGIDPRFVAIEVNLELIPREEHAAYIVKPNDRIEIVTLVGGG